MRLASSSAGLTRRVQNGRQSRAPESSFLWYVRRDHKGGKIRGGSWSNTEVGARSRRALPRVHATGLERRRGTPSTPLR